MQPLLVVRPAFPLKVLVERLLAEGVDIAVADTQNRTALLHSVISKHDAITHLLLAHHSELVRSRRSCASKVQNVDRRRGLQSTVGGAGRLCIATTRSVVPLRSAVDVKKGAGWPHVH